MQSSSRPVKGKKYFSVSLLVREKSSDHVATWTIKATTSDLQEEGCQYCGSCYSTSFRVDGGIRSGVSSGA
jgi:hypothetical protein